MHEVDETYHSLQRAIESAGFFAIIETDSVVDGRDHRVTCASRRREGRGFTGNSFWVSLRAARWYVGTWGSRIYLLPETKQIADFCISWMKEDPNTTVGDLSENVKQEFGLLPVAHENFPE